MPAPVNGATPKTSADVAGHGSHGRLAGGAAFTDALHVALQVRAAKAESPQLASAGRPHASHDDIHERALAVYAYRLQILASNIANVDTPGYKARDIDAAQALREKTALRDIPLLYTSPIQPSIDNNTVDLALERAKFADAAIRYEFALDRVSGHYKHMMELFKNLSP